ncbi:MAG: T9SS type A sorting domain-containing protein [Bacteroidota bacterium]
MKILLKILQRLLLALHSLLKGIFIGQTNKVYLLNIFIFVIFLSLYPSFLLSQTPSGSFTFDFLSANPPSSAVVWDNCSSPGEIVIIFEGQFDNIVVGPGGLTIEISFKVKIERDGIDLLIPVYKDFLVEREYNPGQTLNGSFTEIFIADLSYLSNTASGILDISTDLEFVDIFGVSNPNQEYEILGFVDPIGILGQGTIYQKFSGSPSVVSTPELSVPVILNNLEASFDLLQTTLGPNIYEITSGITSSLVNPVIPTQNKKSWVFDYTYQIGTIQQSVFEAESLTNTSDPFVLACGSHIVTATIIPKAWDGNSYIPIGCDFDYEGEICVDRTSEFSCERVFCGDSPLRKKDESIEIFNIVPNYILSTDKLNVQIDSRTKKIVYYEILDLRGQIKASGSFNVTREQSSQKLSLPDSSKGIYLIRFNVGQEVHIRRFIII